MSTCLRKVRVSGTCVRSRRESASQDLRQQRLHLLKNKQALWFRQMCKDAGIEDQELCQDLLAGISLVGQAKCSTKLMPKVKPARMRMPQVMKSAKWMQKTAMAGSCKSKEAQLDEEVWKEK